MKKDELDLFLAEAELWEPERILTWAVRLFKGRIVLTCSFGGGGIVLAHMLSRRHPDVPVLFLDTGFHFQETLQFKERFAKQFGLNVMTIRPRLTVEEQTARFGPDLFARRPDACCNMRKVEPLAAALLEKQVDAWVSALRRDQSPTRQDVKMGEWHTIDAPKERSDLTGSRLVLKIHPLANWTRADVERYIAQHELPYHPLLDQGYTSIGCAPCTVPVNPLTADERAGRWAGTTKVECGLHTFSRRLGGTKDAKSDGASRP